MKKKAAVIFSSLILIWTAVTPLVGQTPANLKKTVAAIDPILPTSWLEQWLQLSFQAD